MDAPELQRVTTRFYPAQDRICLSGELPQTHVALWLTQRMLRRLLPILWEWLAMHSPFEAAGSSVDAWQRDVVEGFAQQAARTQLEQMAPVTPVRVAADSPEYLITSVQVDRSAQRLRLVLLRDDAPVAQMVLYQQPLRQWLNILFDAWRRAEWPTDVWPAWMTEVSGDLLKATSAPVH